MSYAMIFQYHFIYPPGLSWLIAILEYQRYSGLSKVDIRLYSHVQGQDHGHAESINMNTV